MRTLVAYAACGVLGCSGADAPSAPPAGGARVTRVSISSPAGSVAEGDTVRLVATVGATGGAPITVSWSTDNDSLATISAAGVLVARRAGTVRVTAASTYTTSVTAAVDIAIAQRVEVKTTSADQAGTTVTMASGTSVRIDAGVLSGAGTIAVTEKGLPRDVGAPTYALVVRVRGPSRDTARVAVRLSVPFTSTVSAGRELVAIARDTVDPRKPVRYASVSAAAGSSVPARLSAGAATTTAFIDVLLDVGTEWVIQFLQVPVQDRVSCAGVLELNEYARPAQGRSTRAIVLVHGWQASRLCAAGADVALLARLPNVSSMIGYDPTTDLVPMANALRQAFPTTPIYVARYPTPLHPRENGADLRNLIATLRNQGVSSAILVGHSMGGLVARYAAAEDAGQAQRIISSIVTLGTPHEGSPFADVVTSQPFVKTPGVLALRTSENRDDIPLPGPVPISALRGGLPCSVSVLSPFETWLLRAVCEAVGQSSSSPVEAGDGIVPNSSALASGRIPELTWSRPAIAFHTQLMELSGAISAVVAHLASALAWQPAGTMLQARETAFAFTSNEVLHLAGGFNGGSDLATMESYEASVSGWRSRAAMPSSRYAGNGAQVVNGRAFVFGGFVFPQSPIGTTTAYNLASGQWTSASRNPVAGGCGASGVVAEKIVVLTACNSATGYITDFREYDPATDGWRQLASPRSLHVYPAGAVVNGKFYLVGGASNTANVASGVLEVYDPALNQWTTLDPMPTPRIGASAVALAGLLYVIGGQTTVGTATGVVEVYNPATGRWLPGPSLQQPRVHAVSAVVRGGILVAGGSNGRSTYFRSVEHLLP